jgi:hypothetical protein
MTHSVLGLVWVDSSPIVVMCRYSSERTMSELARLSLVARTDSETASQRADGGQSCWGDYMAILIFPIGVLVGWLIRPPRRAAAVTAAAGLGGLAFFVVLGLNSEGVSPIETAVLVLGTPIAAALAFKISKWRLGRASTRS